MRILVLTFISLLIFACNNDKEVEKSVEVNNLRIDSLQKVNNVDLNLDSFLNHKDYFGLNTVFFQNIDSNKICFQSDLSIFDIEKSDSTNYNVKFVLLDNTLLLNLSTKDKRLVKRIEDLSKSYLNNNYLVFKLNGKSFKSITGFDSQGDLSKTIIGSGEIIEIYDQDNFK